MNERIEELAEQCVTRKFYVDHASEDFDYKKFAELIVAECINMIEAGAKTADEDSVHGMRNAAGLIGRAFNI